MRRVIIVHGWEGYPEEGWFPWLKKEFEAREVVVFVPQMPNPANPRINEWVPALEKEVGEVDADTFFVGHSMGCQAIVRFLSAQSNKAGGAVFVGGWFKRLTGLEDDQEVQETDRHWIGTPVDFEKARQNLPRSVAIFSDDDPWVPLDNQVDFRDKLGSEIVTLKGMKHFSGSQGITKLPEARDALLKMIGE